MAIGRASREATRDVTALQRYARLEAEGVWRASPDARRQDVIVALGDATLVISDRGERALAHWSLPAVERMGSGMPALYVPGPDADEELEVADPEMVTAIDQVRAAVARRQARPGALRAWLFGGLLAAVVAAGAIWLPDAILRHTARVVPTPTRADIGERLLDHVTRLTGPPCAESPGNRPLARLDRRLRGADPGRLVLVPGGAVESVHLPGGTIVLRRTLVEDHELPAVVAGYVLAEEAERQARDPLLDMLEAAGPIVAFRLLTTGRIADHVLAAEAERLVTGTGAEPGHDAVIAAFAAAEVSTEPYAYARDVTGESTLWLIEADPVAGGAKPILSDGDWVALQGACGG